MNLLEEKWLPVKRKSGEIDWIAPDQISEPDIIALAANRADFNAALAQLLIGLLQTTTPVDDEDDWDALLNDPPSCQTLQQWFASVTEAFVFDGDGARFMQDIELVDGAQCSIDSLLIDAAGGSAIDNNTDHFVKRSTVNCLCMHCAATALFTLQTNAPAGGAGHRTSLRGGGPLTTLICATPVTSNMHSFWQTLWLNVLPQRISLQSQGDSQKIAMHMRFSWLAPIDKIQKPGSETQPVQAHPHHIFWAMPRRIRFDLASNEHGSCDVCKRKNQSLVRRYVTRPQGLNYKGPWRHPFSPYYQNKEDWLPVHPQPGGFSYKNWAAWVLGVQQSKKVVQAASTLSYFLQHRAKHQESALLRLWLFGYDMDNMKARCWYETTFPLFAVNDVGRDMQKQFQSTASFLIEAAEHTVFLLRQAVRHAWFGDSDSRGDFSFVDKAFWDATQGAFYRQLDALFHQARSASGIDLDNEKWLVPFSESWRKVLEKTALDLFELDIVGAGAIDQQDPRRIADAHRRLKNELNGDALRKILRLPLPENSSKNKKSNAVQQAALPL